MEAVDTVYEYAGYQASAGLYDVLLSLGIPLIIALGGLAWRFFRVAEDGLPRPLAFYVLGLTALWWLLSPTAVTQEAGSNVRAPRFVVWLGAATDAAVHRSIRSVNEGFLRRPFEWERLAAMSGLARVYDPQTRENLQAFFGSCTGPALAALDVAPPPRAEQNPLAADSGLDYRRHTVLWQAGSARGIEVACPSARAELAAAVEREIDTNDFHRRARQALRDYGLRSVRSESLEKLYFDQVVRNEWHGIAGDAGEMAAVRESVGEYALLDPRQRQRTVRMTGSPLLPGIAGDLAEALFGYDLNLKTSLYAVGKQVLSDAVEAKQKYYLVTTMAPELYGICIMILIALFPIAGLWALLPGKWTALVHFGKVFVSVKLWPLGWAILSGFGARRPAAEAFSIPGQPDAGTGNLFLAIVMMYFLVPAVCFILVNISVTAAALPFREATPRPAGGDPARDALSAASMAR